MPPSRSRTTTTAEWWTNGLSGTRQLRAKHAAHLTAGRGPDEVEVVDGHVQYVRVTHRVPEVVRREERPCVAPAAYLYRHRLSDETIANDPLHGAKRRVVAVVLADDEKALHPGSNSYEVERVIEAGGQWLLAQHVFPRLQRGPRHNVMRPWRQNHQHRITL